MLGVLFFLCPYCESKNPPGLGALKRTGLMNLRYTYRRFAVSKIWGSFRGNSLNFAFRVKPNASVCREENSYRPRIWFARSAQRTFGTGTLDTFGASTFDFDHPLRFPFLTVSRNNESLS